MPKFNWKIVAVLFFTFLLRIPSFFEPNWYGDEGIYLAIGQALQRGATLYKDIWDNKTPLLYFIYAIWPTVLWAKISATICVLLTTYLSYRITKKLLVAVLTGLFLSLPIFEGNIANAELYFTLPIIISVYLFLRHSGRVQNLLIGLCLTIAFLIKVPAIFDFIGLFLAYFIINRKIKPFIYIFTPLLISILFFSSYFLYHNAFGDFITASFFQNASYVSVDSGPFSKLSNPLFIKGVILLFFTILSAIFYWKKKISSELLYLSLWFGFSLYGATLSNRPYPHYLLQIIPPLIIFIFYIMQNFKKYFYYFIPIGAGLFFTLQIFANQIYFLSDLLKRHDVPYYSNFFNYIFEKISWDEYVNNFDNRTTSNYEIGRYLADRTSPQEPVFFWGDNAFIYVNSNRQPATKFIQAHHLSTIDQKNLDDIIDVLNTKRPLFIIVAKPMRFSFNQLEEFITKNYRLVKTIDGNEIYKAWGDFFNKSTR